MQYDVHYTKPLAERCFYIFCMFIRCVRRSNRSRNRSPRRVAPTVALCKQACTPLLVTLQCTIYSDSVTKLALERRKVVKTQKRGGTEERAKAWVGFLERGQPAPTR